ncbi:hypothetical protein LAZ67_5000618 [Cordylochernes scorpioides]|uniref:CCHC-type domain-containing protein n=1 Tax=Cordylochernes scorpioides TaxID=51811 RepID=A0ABY6KI22_9ARAC|nr:hypothetical protein LAZ67_5000618 [Cordylochernes scorpioides]
MEDEILNKNFDDDSETENYSLNESSDVSTDEECDSILTTVQMSSSNCFIGKNGYKWNKNHAIIGRTRSHNIITHLPGLKGPAKPKPNCSIDIFNLFFTAAIIKQISEFTNAKIEEFRQRISDLTKSTYSNFTSEIEIRAFLGLLYLAGVYKSGHENVESLFASDGTGRDIFRSVMSVKRFLFLLLCIRFDNFKTRCKVDRLSPIRDIFQTIIEKFQSCYTPAEYLTVDEMLVGFRGKCPFKIYIPSKPNKYGIKIVILADSRTHYMYNAMVYTGKSKTPKSKELSLPTQIVLDISRPLWKSNRNITADNWFTSIELVDKLKEHGLTYLGTMRKNKPQIPPQFQPHPKRESGTSIFGFSGTKTLVSYVPKKRKSVILISSMHHDNKCDKTTGKPDIIMDYNLTKGSVDTIEQMVSNFSTSCRSRRWPLALFYALLDITALNSYIIFNYQIDKKDQKERSTFIVDLGRSLIDEHLATRNLNSLPLELQTTIKKFKNNDGSSTSRGSTMPQESDTPKRCYKCPSKNAGKVKTLCSVHKWVESTHPVQLRKKKSPVQLRVNISEFQVLYFVHITQEPPSTLLYHIVFIDCSLPNGNIDVKIITSGLLSSGGRGCLGLGSSVPTAQDSAGWCDMESFTSTRQTTIVTPDMLPPPEAGSWKEGHPPVRKDTARPATVSHIGGGRDEKKKAYLLTLMGSKTYGVLKNLCSPILPKNKTFDNLIDILKRHFSPKRSIVVERFIFFKRMQLKEESISDYLVEIKRLASSCNFGNFLEDSLRDKMVCGLYNAKIQNRILSEGDISLAKIIEIALSMEAAEKNTKLFHLEQGEDCVDKLRMERKVESNFQNGKCKHCGKLHKEPCRFKEAICFKCNKKGHIASICWSSRRNLRQHQNQPGNIHQIGDQEEEEEYVQKIISVTIPEYKINFASLSDGVKSRRKLY